MFNFFKRKKRTKPAVVTHTPAIPTGGSAIKQTQRVEHIHTSYTAPTYNSSPDIIDSIVTAEIVSSALDSSSSYDSSSSSDSYGGYDGGGSSFDGGGASGDW